MKYSFSLILMVFICSSCKILNIAEDLEKNFEKIERADYFLYFYPDSQIYIKKDKSSNKFTVFLNVMLDSNLNFTKGYLKLIQDSKYIGSIAISKVVSIGNFKFLYINLDKNNFALMSRALTPYKKLVFLFNEESFQVWTKDTLQYDPRFIDVNFENTKNTLEYAFKNKIL
ncbi:hypothetical protein [Borreliella afzelii]|uniref:Uncharacterized protein n=2 Tax=Borreliella afzelii TaxID=29518 RepID=Q0SL32_BORAP|nr:hypothetical protein [Borreliella afzelii]ABH02446.1 hypothetical protein BAPKO_5022 [Borreliella afzelii PKo]AJY72908.1 hypothetical protein BAFK78_B023 [Borreliella afzelii K78]AEL70082.1 conserved hypothetical protein [Borreliella afzelii PKo]AIK19149.1 hypothetical protein P612_04480 [Borreliella afzelii Tom3107]MBB5141739.1 hypothetical protein [Borreliella afzelii]